MITHPPRPGDGQPQSRFAAKIAALNALDLPHPDTGKPCPPVPRPFRLPFGRYRGLPLSQIPADYLLWVLRVVKLSRGLRAAVSDELACRDMFPPLPPDTRVVGKGG